MNRDFFKIHLSITLARINILTSSFFLAITLSKALHLTPILLKLERFFFSPYKGGPIFKNPFPQAVFRCTTIFFLFLGIFDIEWLIPPYGPRISLNFHEITGPYWGTCIKLKHWKKWFWYISESCVFYQILTKIR